MNGTSKRNARARTFARTLLALLATSTLSATCDPPSPTVDGGVPADGSAPDGGVTLPPPIPTPFRNDYLPPDTIRPSAGVGGPVRRLDMNDSGDATMSIPLWVPAGRMGVQPALSLNYSSSGGNGNVGVGWSLSGFSQVSRCVRSIAIDGEIDRIRFDRTDRFCLDGQRLVVVSGAYGAVGAEYRTEHNTFARIRSHGGAQGEPHFWTVEDGSGITRTYSTQHRVTRIQADAEGAVTQVGRHVYHWLITNVEDPRGNEVFFGYSQRGGPDYATELRPNLIEYNYPSGGGRGALHRISFTWEARPDPTEQWVNGVHTQLSERISRIEVQEYVPASQSYRAVRSYRLGYRGDSISARSLLRSFQECGGAGVCLPATTIEWELGNYDFDVIDYRDHRSR